VHDYRKALRRARAVLGLVGGALPKSERRAVARALRDARRALGTSRDHAVAPEALSSLPLGEAERETAKLVASAAAAAMPPIAEIKQLLAEGAARALAQVEALEAALPASISWSSVLRGVRTVYNDARSARKAAKRSRRSFHSWRRRSKELTYQLEVLANYAGANTTLIASEVSGVTDTQGPAVDLIMLRDFVRTYGEGISPEALDHLTVAINAELDGLMADSRAAAREAFRRKPRQFAKKLAKAVRRDQAPVVDHPQGD
jgi:CHAD domain-containing protein